MKMVLRFLICFFEVNDKCGLFCEMMNVRFMMNV